jgi:4-amino-4-deoxy-L-arabinose transferase-like glycosyltransferase
LNARKHLVLLILLTTLVRLAFAAATGLGVDESYMVAAGRTLGLGYFDHPPAAWWLSWGAAHLFGSEAPIVVRLPFIALFALSTALMARLTPADADARSGWWAALLLNLSPVFGVTTASWVLPDGPLDCALLGAAVCLVRALPARDKAAVGWWGGTGVCAGLALFSKYSAGLTIAGAMFYLATSRAHRHWLRRAEPYGAGLLALIVFAPVLVWNATHGWASFAFQGDRAIGLRLHPLAPVITWLGEALFVLPWFWLPLIWLFIGALAPRFGIIFRLGRRPPPAAVPGSAAADHAYLLACLAAPPILLFALISAWSSQRVLFHWAAPGYLMMFPLLGQWAARYADRAWLRRTVIGTATLVVLTLAVIGSQTRFDWLASAITAVARHDPTIEGIDWVSLQTELAARGLLPPGSVVGVPNWRDAGKIGYALGPGVTVLCLSRDAREFGFADPPSRFLGRDVLLLITDHADRVEPELARHFARVEALPPAQIRLGGRVLRSVAVYRGETLLDWP